MILGGSEVGLGVARRLSERRHIRVKLVEPDRARRDLGVRIVPAQIATSGTGARARRSLLAGLALRPRLQLDLLVELPSLLPRADELAIKQYAALTRGEDEFVRRMFSN